jgi:DNA-binding transcriptional MerR regulator
VDLVPWNVRLSRVLCNREDYGWRMRIRRMLEKGMSLEEIAENLNDKRVRRPHGSSTWSATAVRKAFVSLGEVQDPRSRPVAWNAVGCNDNSVVTEEIAHHRLRASRTSL